MNEQRNKAEALTSASNDDDDGRQTHRRRTLKQARAVLSDFSTVDCRIRDVSQGGAHLVFGGPVSLPDAFRLHNVSDKTIAPVELKWQRGLEAGIAFTGPQEPHAEQ